MVRCTLRSDKSGLTLLFMQFISISERAFKVVFSRVGLSDIFFWLVTFFRLNSGLYVLFDTRIRAATSGNTLIALQDLFHTQCCGEHFYLVKGFENNIGSDQLHYYALCNVV